MYEDLFDVCRRDGHYVNNDFVLLLVNFTHALFRMFHIPSGTYGHNTHEGKDKTNMTNILNYVNLQMNV